MLDIQKFLPRFFQKAGVAYSCFPSKSGGKSPRFMEDLWKLGCFLGVIVGGCGSGGVEYVISG